MPSRTRLRLLTAATFVIATTLAAPQTYAHDVSAEPSVEHGRVYVDGVRLHYVRAGAGPAVVLLHGFPQTWYEWRRVMPLLAKRNSVIAFDLRGLGDSDRTATGYDAEQVSRDISQALDSLGVRDATVVGHDVGGAPAYILAADRPDIIKGLVLVETMLPGAGMEQVVAAAGPNLWHINFQSALDVPEALVSGREREYVSLFFRSFSVNPETFSDEDVAYYGARYAAPGAMRAAFSYFRANPLNAEQVKQRAFKKLSIPVLGLAGRGSLGNPMLGDPLQNAMRQVATDITYEVVDAGHWVPEERPELFADRVQRLVDRVHKAKANK